LVAECVTSGDFRNIAKHVREALKNGFSAEEILNGSLIKGMEVVGTRFRNEQIFVPEVMVAARAMKEGMNVLLPILGDISTKGSGTIVIGTVKGDLHDIGKNIVCTMLQGHGLNVLDLGIDVAPERFIEAVQHSGAKVIGLSALLTTTISSMEKTIAIVKEKLPDSGLRFIVGGAPVNKTIASQVGADAYGKNAAEAVLEVSELLSPSLPSF
jgi:5-methyltetrahydrofolate--homocysteine methyltransferase